MSQDETERYQLQDQIGSGGMATVYRARDSVLQRVVALKLLNGGQVEPALKERFQREAQSVAQLSHENIVRIYDGGERDGSPYIVMEYVEGSNLKKRIQAHGPLTTHEAVEVVTQVGAALEYAHANGLIHCDVKPHNILISPNGRSKLVDFGIAQAQVDRTRRDSEQVYGTPLYMAPEQASGGRASSRTDVYGLGLVLWEALSGSPPERTGRYDPVKLDFDSAQIPHAFEEAIKRATAFDPDDRYVSVDDMVHAVATAVKDPEDREETTVPFRPDGAAHSSYRSVRPDRILPIPADDGASEPEPRVQRQRAEPARRPPQERVRRRRLTAPVVLLLLALLLLGSFAAWRYIQTGSAPWLSASSTVTAPVFEHDARRGSGRGG
ncbi:MAG: serine/threonine-protein kinase [Chloroflexia bacterium]